MYTGEQHTFAICAYKESVFLEDAIKSVKHQSVRSNIIMVTSTPNVLIEELSKKYEIPLFINDGEAGIAGDWNFGYQKADTELVTICHQDDIYEKHYVEKILKKVNQSKKPLIAFCDYGELRNGEKVFFLLDEIFKGTNSNDRHDGARILIEQLVKLQGVGLVSTHDLELCNLEQEKSWLVNYSFREYYENNKINFDYILRYGRSNTQNAKHLMKLAGIDIER